MFELQPLAFRKALGEVFFQCVAARHPLAVSREKIAVGGVASGHDLDVPLVEGGHKRFVSFLEAFLVPTVRLVTRHRCSAHRFLSFGSYEDRTSRGLGHPVNSSKAI